MCLRRSHRKSASGSSWDTRGRACTGRLISTAMLVLTRVLQSTGSFTSSIEAVRKLNCAQQEMQPEVHGRMKTRPASLFTSQAVLIRGNARASVYRSTEHPVL